MFPRELIFILSSAILAICVFSATVLALPSIPLSNELQARQYPYFPDQPPSCPICAQNYDNIDSCAQAAPVFANVSAIIWNPGAFISAIECACTDTFQSAYPQCVDCFQKTDQTQYLNASDVPAILSGIRSVCAFMSTMMGNVSDVDGETSPTPSAVAPSPTATNRASVVARLSPEVLAFGISVVFGVHMWI